jgi:hypothetical protein
MKAILIVVTLIAFASAADAQSPTYTDPDGTVIACTARRPNGTLVPVAGVNGNAGGYAAFATFDAMGNPIIIFDVTQLLAEPAHYRKFVVYHECAHHSPLTLHPMPEIAANCSSLIFMRQQLGLPGALENDIGVRTIAKGQLQQQYGGSGAAFWNLTLQCANRVSQRNP